ncbi:MAG: hypothetical protein IPM39_05855 [Chloroflexi bacterium]|nr:hypothetical protein [Chloroflexota bacterium]
MGGYSLVTSDREIIRAAQMQRIRFLQSEQFIARMGFAPVTAPKEPLAEKEPEKGTAVSPPKPTDPRVSEAEVQEWLDLFGPVPERPKARPKPTTAPPPPAAQPDAPKKPARLRVVKDDSEDRLEADEVEAWLNLFRSDGRKK